MKTMGFLISHKNNEGRIALLPKQLCNIKHPEQLYFEEHYGETLGIADEEYERNGANIVSRNQVLKCDIIVDVKLGDADYLNKINDPKVFVGWAHAVQKTEFTTNMMEGKHTVIAWENIFEDGRYIFYRNREVAGEAAIIHGFRYSGMMPYDAKVAVIGNGQVAKGACRVLNGLGADVTIYGRKLEKLFRKEFANYDVIVNCVYWDTNRKDRLLYREDLKKMKHGSLIIDISCDPELEIETSLPTTIDNPVYTVDGIVHYAVDNTPAMFPKTVSKYLSEGYCKYIDAILQNDYPECIENAVVIRNGLIIDEKIINFRKARNLPCT